LIVRPHGGISCRLTHDHRRHPQTGRLHPIRTHAAATAAYIWVFTSLTSHAIQPRQRCRADCVTQHPACPHPTACQGSNAAHRPSRPGVVEPPPFPPFIATSTPPTGPATVSYAPCPQLVMPTRAAPGQSCNHPCQSSSCSTGSHAHHQSVMRSCPAGIPRQWQYCAHTAAPIDRG
jgi:hypothetical protein